MLKHLTVLFLFVMTTVALSNPPLPDILTGTVKGTALVNHTYTVQDSIVINVGDTLRISPGDTLKMANDPATGGAGWIHILGTFICEGTSTNRIVITTATAGAKSPGMWGGIIGDSCKYVSVKFTNILWAGGNDKTGHAYRTFDIYSNYANTTQTVFTDNLVVGTVDDCIGLHAGNASVLRNYIKWCGAPDGDNINIKDGVNGEIAYNVIWASGGNGIKVNSSTSLPRLSNVYIHNNTIVAGGWRRVEELGYAILIDKSSRAQIYNNIMGDMYAELEITSKADTIRTVYANNLFFYSVDSLKGVVRYYPSDGVGKIQSNDILDVKASALFKSYSPFFTNDWIALDGTNDYRILSTSAAAGKGFTPPTPTLTNYWGNPSFGNGTAALPGDANIGALGVASVTAAEELNSGVPTGFSLGQNYPNPFNPSTKISYTLHESGQVSLKIFNSLGQVMMSVDQGFKHAGSYTVNVRMDQFSSGVYFYTLHQGSNILSKKMLLLK
jgi:hypothetical protein